CYPTRRSSDLGTLEKEEGPDERCRCHREEERKMTLRRFLAGSSAAALLALPLLAVPAAAQEGEVQYFPALPYRSGPYAPSGIPLGSGYADYLTMLQERDAGIQGVASHYEACA